MLSSLWGSKPSSSSPSNEPAKPNDQQPSTTTTPPQNQPENQQPQKDSQFPQRPLKLLLAGTTFLTLSLYLTRRALRARRLTSIPPYYTSSTYHHPPVNGALDAFEAFNLATINVVSFAMVGTGGVMWKLGVNDVEDARRITRRFIVEEGTGEGVDGVWGGEVNSGKEEDVEAEKAIERWVVETLGLKGYEEKKREILEERARTEGGKSER
ncbi:uncharacterized protein ASPGLDRAFT_47192 [Aspergillus glaucus CBS 516.65]|uniref:Altered inheritance of mitochondria protein 11 n=1 Tax=Aspergillus glaucus CBS 516.65 TaxID=1160497 RepID=A0A1L9VK84_ASPGL|nr:hypothetical protein ASPGLDRAFT_47192 [Aspergillus glaucus CBS 516.65]OJJ84323.1 hypothetical protein ASPGLDRAFT_47192 [Aspergillus glaucus CBS 516.65]